MYFFLLNLALLDLRAISTTVPKAMANSLWDTRAISHPRCAAQVFLFTFLISAELCLLTVMAYDRYVAICKPLHYGTLLGSRACVHMAAAAWGCGLVTAVLHTANTFSLPLCQGNAVDQFFCEVPQILKLSCSDAYLREVAVLVVSVCLAFGCFVFIVLSYGQIFRAVLRIPCKQGQHKAFSTCLPHLAVVSLFVSTGMIACLKPPSISSPSLDLVVAVLYSVVPPAVNPLIYSMRNHEIKGALRKHLLVTPVLQNHRHVVIGRDLWRSSSSTPSAEEGSARGLQLLFLVGTSFIMMLPPAIYSSMPLLRSKAFLDKGSYYLVEAFLVTSLPLALEPHLRCCSPNGHQRPPPAAQTVGTLCAMTEL
ncbi:olfactory receptor 14A16-like, partial [Harpia harpyja]|uniref:olfactory receptor 14A16-like n=1 Tax=Harpia harpyja TaxID=202280 RepID=UPI0022B0C931